MSLVFWNSFIIRFKEPLIEYFPIGSNDFIFFNVCKTMDYVDFKDVAEFRHVRVIAHRMLE